MRYRTDCLIVDEMHGSLLPMMERAGIRAVYKPKAGRDEVLAEIGGYQGIVVRSKLRLDTAFFKKAGSLVWVARAGAGTDNIDMAAAEAHGVRVFNAPEGNRDAVGEHTLGLLLALMNRIPQGDAEVRAGIWRREPNRGYEVGGKTVGLIGYGNMGQAFAQRLRGFGCRVIAYDKYREDWPDAGVERVTLEELWAQAEILSLHVPLTRETRGWVNASFFGRLQKPVWLLNTARGEVVSSADLLYAIQQGIVRGAALDVLENEKFETLLTPERAVLQGLIDTGKVLFTPHVAGWTHESYVRINEVLVQKILDAFPE